MHRLTVALLAAFDALIAVAVSVGFIVAPLTLFWALDLHGPWDALWPTAASIWQLGHFVPQIMHLPLELLTATGVATEAASFTLSLAPLAFASFAAIFAARSGIRAARAGAWFSGVFSGAVVYAGFGALIWITSRNGTAAVWGWQALLFPALVYAVPLLCGALVEAWRDGDDGGLVDLVHDRVDALSIEWSELPALAGRGLAIVLVSCIAFGALGVGVMVALRGGEMISLFQAARVDAWGAVLLTLVHLALLPNLIVWAFAWIAGPGFAVGAGTAVSPAGTELGVLPGVPLAGLIPEHVSIWFLALALLPVLAGVGAGWALRSRYAAVLGADEPFLPRLVLTLVVALGSGAIAALAGFLSGGSLGPGRLEHVGPDPLMLGLALAAEVAVGAGILLLSPRRTDAGGWTGEWHDDDTDDADDDATDASDVDADVPEADRPHAALDAHLAALRAERDAAEGPDARR